MDYFEMMRSITTDHAAKFLPKCSHCGTHVTPQEVSNGTVHVDTVRFETGEVSRSYEHTECREAIEEGFRSGAW